ncbi:hypothetical protein M427DRAFT_159869 [Gonapodya prolifera JEL478]|uniref:RMT2 domain-containing protein n=1 Tax=Gonapodya prolifera (strain JEL478) TaxID=1344416 RepID=A0A138ZZS0_GONPJ|nr:hypothetical protein M427DRAFT_159869 [Gonapodya prolifera JEL478]|eukprot:KXS10000.1 hypothetical protein M427DRAFT_159869 [Gonapodya prolifera JEL478]
MPHAVPSPPSSDAAYFFSAVAAADIPLVSSILNEHPDIIHETQPDHPRRSALHLAAETGSIPLVELLIDRGCPWNAADDDYCTAGEIAKQKGHEELYERLVDEGVRCELVLRALMDMDVDEDDDEEVDDAVVEDADDAGNEEGSNDVDGDGHAEVDVSAAAEETTSATTLPLPAIDMTVHGKSIYVNGRRVVIGGSLAADKSEAVDKADGGVEMEIEKSTGTSLEEYLSRPVSYSHDKDGNERLLDDEGNPIEMEWERPIMIATAEAILPLPKEGASPTLTGLNIGFGMGMVDTAIQARRPLNHYICEAHPIVLERMVSTGWIDRGTLSEPRTSSTSRPSARCLVGTWQDTLSAEGLAKAGVPPNSFDGIFFDTFSEVYETSLLPLHKSYLPRLLRRPDPADPADTGGVYSFFNGLASGNTFFHDVACRVAEADLREAGFEVEWVNVPFAGPEEVTGDVKGGKEAIGEGEAVKGVWEGTRYAYWRLGGVYRMPLVRWARE